MRERITETLEDPIRATGDRERHATALKTGHPDAHEDLEAVVADLEAGGVDPSWIIEPVCEEPEVFGLPRERIGRAGFDPPARPARHSLPSGAQHHPCESVRAPDGDGHILPEVAVVEVAGCQRADLEDGAGAALELDDARHMIG